MKIDLICNDGSPIGVTPKLIYGRGVGGAELSMMTLMEVLASRGHEVAVYNDPAGAGEYEGVNYLPLSSFDVGKPRDGLIIYRSPNIRYNPRYRGQFSTIWWSTDQYTVGDFRALAASVDFSVTISPYHTEHHIRRYKVPRDKIGHIDLGVRLSDYSEEVEKVRDRMIFCSIPDRGLELLLNAWPRIRERVADASLVITSDYTLWGAPNPANHQWRLRWARQEGVQFLGAIPRHDLIKHQQMAEIQSYPCIYEELFCISAAECAVAGALPVTSGAGALVTTNEFGIIVPGEPNTSAFVANFVDRITSLLTHERQYMEKTARTMKAGAAMRFDWNVIAEKWEHLIEEGKLK